MRRAVQGPAASDGARDHRFGFVGAQRARAHCDRSRSQWGPVRVHVVEPGTPGSGVYAVDQPDYLILNTPCGQVSLYPWQDEGPSPAYAVGLYEWVTSAGYRWVGDTCRIDPARARDHPDDYLPRRLMGEYLQWFYATLVESAPAKVEIVHHRVEAVDIEAQRDGRERIKLANGDCLDVDYVILTSGHTDNLQPDANPAHFPRPYPVGRYSATIPAGSSVAVEGLGLVAPRRPHGPDGRTGRHRSSRRATGCATSPRDRSRRSASSRAAGSPTARRRWRPSTRATSSRLSSAPRRRSARSRADADTGLPRRQIDFRSTVLPLILGEMQIRYYSQSAFLEIGRAAAESVRQELARAWHDGSYESAVAGSGRPLRRVRPGLALLRPRHRLRILQGLRVAGLRDGRDGSRRVAPRRVVPGKVRLRGVPASSGTSCGR